MNDKPFKVSENLEGLDHNSPDRIQGYKQKGLCAFFHLPRMEERQYRGVFRW